MPEEKNKSDTVGRVAQAISDPITKFWEGIAQIGHELFKDKGLMRQLVMLITGAISFDLFLTKVGDLIKGDEESRQAARREARMEFLALCKDLGKQGWEFIAGQINVLRQKSLMDEAELESILDNLATKNTALKNAIENSQNQRAWLCKLGPLTLLIALAWACASTGGAVLVTIIALLIAGSFIGFQNKSFTALFTGVTEPATEAAANNTDGGE